MAYEQADVELWQWAEDQTFGATSVTHNIMGPRGKVGFVRDIIVDVTTAVTWGSMTAPAEVMVGISSGDFTFGRYRLGTNVSTGYGVGIHRASQEPWTGNPPRTLADFTGHVVLDGGPLTSAGIAGGSYGTQVPQGRIPTTMTVNNVISGTGSTDRLFVNGLEAAPGGGPIVGQKVLVEGITGVNSTVNGLQTISAIDTSVPPQWIELNGLTFSGTYSGGGLVVPQVVVTCKAGTGGSPAGGGLVRVKVGWLGPETP